MMKFFSLVFLSFLICGVAKGQDYRYALPTGGDGNSCTIDDPCSFDAALSGSNDGDTIAVSVSRSGSRALIPLTSGVEFPSHFVTLATYDENADGSKLVEGEIELRGTLTVGSGGSINYYPYKQSESRLTLNSNKINIEGGIGFDDLPMTFADYTSSSTFGGNVFIERNSTITVDGICPIVESLNVVSGVDVNVAGSCTDPMGVELFYDVVENANGLYVWNQLNVAGSLVLDDDLNLNLIAPRPNTPEDSAYAIPAVTVDGTISSSGISALYVQIESEMLVDTTSMLVELDSDSTDGMWDERIPTYTGWQNDFDHAFRVSGIGTINLDVIKTTQAGVRIGVDFGSDSRSENSGGVLFVENSTVSGDFYNTGLAQTEFVTESMITGSVFVEGAGEGGIGNSAQDMPESVMECYDFSDRLQGSSNIVPIEVSESAYATVAKTLGSRGLTTGVYFNEGGTIMGNVHLIDGVKNVGTYADTSGTDVDFTCYGGVFVQEQTTIFGDVFGDGVVHFMLNDDLAVEGRFFNVADADEVVVQSMESVMDNSNICKNEAPEAAGAYLTFSGNEASQTLSGDLTIMLGGLRIDKSTGSELELDGVSVVANSLDIIGGTLVTNGMLDLSGGSLYLNQSHSNVGSILGGSSRSVYAELNDMQLHPASITYTGSLASMNTGDEVYEGMELESMEMWLGTAATELTLLTDFSVTDNLLLSRGILEIPSHIELGAPDTITVNDGMVLGNWNSDSVGTVVYRSTTSRLASTQTSATLEDALLASQINIVIDGCTGMVLELPNGFSTIGNVTVAEKNTLDIGENSLVITGDVLAAGDISGEGILYFAQMDTTANEIDLNLTTSDDMLVRDVPSISVLGMVTLNLIGDAVASTSIAPVNPNMVDVANVAGLALDSLSAFTVEGFDVIHIDNDFDLAMGTSVSVNESGGNPQAVLSISGNVGIEGTLDLNGNVLETSGTYMQTSGNVWVAGGSHIAMGDFYVGENANYFLTAFDSLGNHGNVCGDLTEMVDDYTVNTGLFVYSDFSFVGNADAYDVNLTDDLGFRGNVAFSEGATISNSVPFCHVTINGSVDVQSDVSQFGNVWLANGIVHTNGNAWNLSNSDTTDVINSPSMNSYFAGEVTRSVIYGGINGSYTFPVGYGGEYRPLSLRLASTQSDEYSVSVGHSVMDADSLDWPLENLVVDGITLDNLANMFWVVSSDVQLDHDPSVTLFADELANIFDLDGLRVVQWDCDGSNPRSAGVFTDHTFTNGIPTLNHSGVELGNCTLLGIAANFLENPISTDQITSGTARVQFVNNVADDTIPVVDLYLNSNRVVDNFGFQNGTTFGVVPAGNHTLHVVLPDASDNSEPLHSTAVNFQRDMNYHVIGYVGANEVFHVVENVRTESVVNNMVDFYITHGAPGLGTIDIRLLDPIDNQTVLNLLANNVSFGDVGSYLSLAPATYHFEISTANNDAQIDVFRLNLQQYVNEAVLFALSGVGTSSVTGLTMFGVDNEGTSFFPQVITGIENEAPTGFALHGNYPNPFNPTTTVEFDLPESARMTLIVFDILGRVAYKTTSHVEGGASRSIRVDLSNLPSGNYFYRLINEDVKGQIGNGRMVLIK